MVWEAHSIGKRYMLMKPLHISADVTFAQVSLVLPLAREHDHVEVDIASCSSYVLVSDDICYVL